MKEIFNDIADFMISFVTYNGTAIGCDRMIESAFVRDNSHRGEEDQNQLQTLLDFCQDEDEGGEDDDCDNNHTEPLTFAPNRLLKSTRESKPAICFECGVSNLCNYKATNPNNKEECRALNQITDKDDLGVEDIDRRSVVSSLEGSDFVFFPTPSSEMPFFHHRQSPPSSLYYYQAPCVQSVYPVSRTTGQRGEGLAGQQNQNIKSIMAVPFSNFFSPPPDVADRWLKMVDEKHEKDKERGNDNMKHNEEFDDDDKADGTYAFDEISFGQAVDDDNSDADDSRATWRSTNDKNNDDGCGSYSFDEGDLVVTPSHRSVSPFSSFLHSNSQLTVNPNSMVSPNSSSSSRKPLIMTTMTANPNQHTQRRQREENSCFGRKYRFLYTQQQPAHRQRRGGNHSCDMSSTSLPSASYTGTGETVRTAAPFVAKSHWMSAVDPKSGRTYYYHELTRETQWRKPLELATDEEKRAMKEKERKQKDFFAAMEANILNAVSHGIVPGTPSQRGSSDTTGGAGGGGLGIGRRKSSRKVSLGPDGRPELVRTISTMDELVLKDLIRRQPSYRNVKPSLSKEESLRIEDLVPSRSNSVLREFGDSWSHSSHNNVNNDNILPTLQESVRELSMNDGHDSMPALFSYSPDDEPSSSHSDDDGDFSGGASTSLRTDDDSEWNKSNVIGFGLTWEETQAMNRLASITKDMIDSENEDYDLASEKPISNSTLLSAAGATGSFVSTDRKKNKPTRDLPREIDFDDDDDDSDSSIEDTGKVPSSTAIKNDTKIAPTFQKASESGSDGRALPREIELDFEDSDDEDDDDKINKKKKLHLLDEKKMQSSTAIPPQVKRRNTCNTMYVGTTMSAPDKDATIKCICGVYRSHILSSEQDNHFNPDIDPFKIFSDHECNQKFSPSRKLKQSSSTNVGSNVPTLDEITKFYRDVFYKAQMETDCIIMSLIYVERLIKKTGGKLRPRSTNWHSLLFSCMVLSSKVWDDLSMWNVDFSQSCPPGVSFSLQRINELELAVLNALSFKVKVPASEYAKYYFLLRSMLIKSGLAGEDLLSLDPLDVRGARRLQEVSSQFESISLSKKASLLNETNRSQSLNIHSIQQQKTRTTAGLEHIVKM